MKTEVTKRKIDNKYVVWGYTVDPTYRCDTITEESIPYIPQRWIILGVHYDKREAYKQQRKLSKRIK